MIPYRAAPDLSNKAWINDVYKTRFKQVTLLLVVLLVVLLVILSWCDRILHYSNAYSSSLTVRGTRASSCGGRSAAAQRPSATACTRTRCFDGRSTCSY